MKHKPSGAGAVMASKRPKKLSEGTFWQDAELFCTPPWSTRAFVQSVFPLVDDKPMKRQTVHDPCCGLGHMTEVLRESFGEVHATDLHDYGYQYRQHNFLDVGADTQVPPVDWIVANPPFGLALQFFMTARWRAKRGVAFLLRTAWIETQDRHEAVFGGDLRPSLFAPHAERVPMCEGGWDPKGSSATSYSWFIWRLDRPGFVDHRMEAPFFPSFVIPPGQREALTMRKDRMLAGRFMPGWVPPSFVKKTGKDQIDVEQYIASQQ